MKLARFGWLVVFGLCVTTGAAAAPASGGDGYEAADSDTVKNELTIDVPDMAQGSEHTVRGVFHLDDGELTPDFKIRATVRVGESKRVVPVEVKVGPDKVLHFEINFRGKDFALPKGFKGKGVVRFTSNAKGRFGQIEVSSK